MQALFVMQNVPAQRRELPRLEFVPFPPSVTRSKFDVAVFMRDTVNGMFQDWVYSTELFDRSTVLRMASHFENLLCHAVAQPDTRLSALEMRDAQEKQQLEEEKIDRSRTQRKKLMSVKPKAVRVARDASEEEP